MRLGRGLVAAVGAVGLLASGCSSGPKTALSDLHPQITDVQLVTSLSRLATNVRPVLNAVNGTPTRSLTLPSRRHTQYVIGRFSMAADPKDQGAQLALVLIDTDNDKLLTTWSVPESWIRYGWNGYYSGFAKKYSWLSAMAEPKSAGGEVVDEVTTDSWQAGPARSFTFYALLPPDALPLNGPHPHLRAAVIEASSDGHPWTAALLPMTAPHLSSTALYFGHN
jgi:hypothetical protein